MFDIGFWELCLVAIVSLIVIGPEKLPKVARIAGFWVGKTKNMVASVKSEIKEELQEEEIRQMLKQHPTVDDFKNTIEDTSSTFKKNTQSIKQSLKDQSKQINDPK
ncbi:MAG: Sec-independent protein translocase protein TatB [Methylococcaceae bacterium]|nr:Sec-independent protein translocase protein TatB [Methylococcaceae bacterium]